MSKVFIDEVLFFLLIYSFEEILGFFGFFSIVSSGSFPDFCDVSRLVIRVAMSSLDESNSLPKYELRIHNLWL